MITIFDVGTDCWIAISKSDADSGGRNENSEIRWSRFFDWMKDSFLLPQLFSFVGRPSRLAKRGGLEAKFNFF